MIRKFLTVFGFLMALMLAAMAVVLICSINLILNGYHQECGRTAPERIWRNAVPFMCDWKEPAPEQAVRAPRVRYSRTESAPVRVPRDGCGARQYGARVQCDPEVGCYYDLGWRAACGLVDNWDGKR